MVRARGSYPRRRQFDSAHRHQNSPLDFHILRGFDAGRRFAALCRFARFFAPVRCFDLPPKLPPKPLTASFHTFVHGAQILRCGRQIRMSHEAHQHARVISLDRAGEVIPQIFRDELDAAFELFVCHRLQCLLLIRARVCFQVILHPP